MSLVTTKEMFEKAYKGKYAIGAFNVDNMDIMKAVLNACEKKQSPVIIAISSGALKFIGEEYIKERADYATEIIEVSNDIISYNLIKELKSGINKSN